MKHELKWACYPKQNGNNEEEKNSSQRRPAPRRQHRQHSMLLGLSWRRTGQGRRATGARLFMSWKLRLCSSLLHNQKCREWSQANCWACGRRILYCCSICQSLWILPIGENEEYLYDVITHLYYFDFHLIYLTRSNIHIPTSPSL